jgi:hypothetical protein
MSGVKKPATAGPQVAVLVPYRNTDPRQDRKRQLLQFLAHMPAVLDAAVGPHQWAIFIAKQAPFPEVPPTHSSHSEPFCRGRLLNAACMLATARWPTVHTLVLHDVDLLPDAPRLHAALELLPVPFGQLYALNTDSPQYGKCALYCGGIAALSVETFRAANGFQLDFTGWGGEDDCLRDAIKTVATNSHSHPHSFFHAPVAGTVRDLEWEAAQAAHAAGAPPPYRCATDAGAKMPKDARKHVKVLAHAAKFQTNGLRQTAFAIASVTASAAKTASLLTAAGVDAAAYYNCIVMQAVHVYGKTLPPGWTMAMSATTGRPYYYHVAAPHTAQYTWPDSEP